MMWTVRLRRPPPPTDPPAAPPTLAEAVAEVRAVHRTLRTEVRALGLLLAVGALLVATLAASDYRGCTDGNSRAQALRAVVDEAIGPPAQLAALPPEQRQRAVRLRDLTYERTRPANCANPLR